MYALITPTTFKIRYNESRGEVRAIGRLQLHELPARKDGTRTEKDEWINRNPSDKGQANSRHAE